MVVRFFHLSSPQDFRTNPLGHVAPRAVRGRSGWSVDWTSARARRARDCRCGRRPRCAKTSAEARDDATMARRTDCNENAQGELDEASPICPLARWCQLAGGWREGQKANQPRMAAAARGLGSPRAFTSP